MGAVFLAEHPVIGRKAALKVIHPQHARNAEIITRFVNEATAINRIGHEHIVDVTDFGRTPAGDFYFIMEYLEGRPLSDLIVREAPLAPERALRIAGQIADALSASHAHGVIHRDLKPENVFLVTRGEDETFVKVLDFGLAKLLPTSDVGRHETRSGVVMGTPYYMSPEQCEGKAELDQRADVYALGVVLFEMLTGKVPFGGSGYAEVLMKQISMRAPAARSLVPDLPEALDLVLHRALAKNPDERFPTMAAFREALRDPANHGVAPSTSVHDDLSRRMQAARPMSRAEIAFRRRKDPTPASAAISEMVAEDTYLDRVPRRRGARVAAFTIAAAGGIALTFATFFDRPLLRAPSATAAAAERPIVTVSLASDPDGALVVGADGTLLGLTPLSIRMPRAEAATVFTFEKAGFEPKQMAFVPSESSSLFAPLAAEAPAPRADVATADDDPPLPRRAAAAPPRGHARSRLTSRVHDDTDTDGVLTPSFLGANAH